MWVRVEALEFFCFVSGVDVNISLELTAHLQLHRCVPELFFLLSSCSRDPSRLTATWKPQFGHAGAYVLAIHVDNLQSNILLSATLHMISPTEYHSHQYTSWNIQSPTTYKDPRWMSWFVFPLIVLR